MNRRRCLALAAALTVTAAVAAQQPKPEPPKPDPKAAAEYHVLPLKQSSAVDVAKVLSEVFTTGARTSSVRIVAEPTTNALLVAGAADDVARVRELVVKLDAPRPDVAAERTQVRVFALTHIPADRTAYDAVKLLVAKPANNVAVDPRSNQVIVNADEPTLKNVAALLARLDQPAAAARTGPDAMVRVLWLVGGLENAAAPPDDVKEILPTLARLGIDKPRLAAQAIVNVSPNSEFKTAGTAKLDGPCQFGVTGRLEQAPDAPQLQLTIRATRSGGQAAPAPALGGPGGPGGGRFGGGMGGAHGPPEEIGHVQTSISAPPGHLVVLGVTPTDAMTSVFVVQVLRPDAKPAK